MSLKRSKEETIWLSARVQGIIQVAEFELATHKVQIFLEYSHRKFEYNCETNTNE